MAALTVLSVAVAGLGVAVVLLVRCVRNQRRRIDRLWELVEWSHGEFLRHVELSNEWRRISSRHVAAVTEQVSELREKSL